MTPYKFSSVTTTDAELRALGQRLARIRLAANITQADLARQAGVSARSIKRLEAGDNTSLDTLIRVLAALQLGGRLLQALPDPDVRPVERVRLKGRERQRARAQVAPAKATDWAWGDEAKP
ncbi:helix-turn-helix domain-containing protein [Frateuria aurantia]